MPQLKIPHLARALVAAAAMGLSLAGPTGNAVHAQSQQVLAVVGDRPITDYDVTQRLRLDAALGIPVKGSQAEQRKAALEDIIDDVIKQIEAKKNKLAPSDKQVDKAIDGMAARAGTTRDKWAASLRSKGISIDALKQQIAASIGFNWLLESKYKVHVKVDPAEVDRRLAHFTSDPRLQPVKVYSLMEITLPVDSASQANSQQILYARAIEAQQIMQKFKGCSSAHRAVSGIYNVHVSKPLDVPVDKVPGQLKAVLDKKGPGSIVGPMRAKSGIQLVAFCGRTSVSPPKPTREMVQNMITNEKYKVASQRILRDLRRRVFIDYKAMN